jgi:hypothetical protein
MTVLAQLIIAPADLVMAGQLLRGVKRRAEKGSRDK